MILINRQWLSELEFLNEKEVWAKAPEKTEILKVTANRLFYALIQLVHKLIVTFDNNPDIKELLLY